VAKTFFYLGRGFQLIGMWLLLADIVTAGPMGPGARLFGVGVGIFVAGWAITRLTRP